jgi:hypothetical protein
MEPFVVLLPTDAFDESRGTYVQYRFPEPPGSIREVVISGIGPIFLTKGGHVFIPPTDREFENGATLTAVPWSNNIVQVSASMNPASTNVWLLDSNGEVFSLTFDDEIGVEKLDIEEPVKRIQFPFLLTRNNEVYFYNFWSVINKITETSMFQIADLSRPAIDDESKWSIATDGRIWLNELDIKYPLVVPENKPIKLKTMYNHVLAQDGTIFEIAGPYGEGKMVKSWVKYDVPVTQLIEHRDPTFTIQGDANGYVYLENEDSPWNQPLDYMAAILTDMKEGIDDEVQTEDDFHFLFGGMGAKILPFSEYEQDLSSIAAYELLPEDRYGNSVIRYQLENGEIKHVRVLIVDDQVFPGSVISPDSGAGEEEIKDIFSKASKIGRVSTSSNGDETWYFTIIEPDETIT